MTRCIHCTRCVRFGQEIAGVMELGMLHRGEHAEITTFIGRSVDSELSGNMIDLCPVGALTSKPFRYSARTWELSRRKSGEPARLDGNEPDRAGQGSARDARAAARERRDQRMLALRSRPLLLPGAERRYASGRTDDQAGRTVAGGRLEHCARFCRAWSYGHQGGIRRGIGRRVGVGPFDGRGALPAGQADARPGQREHRPPPAPCRLPPPVECALARHADRRPVARCSAR